MTEFLRDGPADAAATLLLAHGAGAAMDSPWMNALTAALVAEGLAVARFEFAYMAARRRGERRPPPRGETLIPEFEAAVAALAFPGRLIIGGKSLGGRVASMAADAIGPAGLVCLGYPFHPPGKPAQTRTGHLAGLATPTLICQGTRDPFGGREEVATYALSPAIEVLWFEDGDHDLAPRKSVTGVSAAGRRRQLAAAIAGWVARLA
ncbi:alpha/beta family hydrolase [Amaricoccus sp.]|uniref:alpha/beta hydrolase family protein n=1 Tax=Amaricoccus sp. TaxID=1872485 RepID=UPI001B740E5C|nr:alpha/beta family hydrolase [Amaricoccus sp.]MBP7000961.1 alpha/beta hydrolase [Amaricoccus sp.]